MIKQSTSSRQAVKKFQQELGLLLFMARVEKKIYLSDVSKATGWPAEFIEGMELGRLPIKRLWRVLRLMRLYGKEVHVHALETPTES